MENYVEVNLVICVFAYNKSANNKGGLYFYLLFSKRLFNEFLLSELLIYLVQAGVSSNLSNLVKRCWTMKLVCYTNASFRLWIKIHFWLVNPVVLKLGVETVLKKFFLKKGLPIVKKKDFLKLSDQTGQK